MLPSLIDSAAIFIIEILIFTDAAPIGIPLIQRFIYQGGPGLVRKISFMNVWMENVSNPIIIDQYYCDSLLPCPNQLQVCRDKLQKPQIWEDVPQLNGLFM
ncbi:hypothetical protein P3S68_001862 [Capsicum galapagoense]